MCGRYVLDLRYGQVHRVLDDNGLPTTDFHRRREFRRGRDYWGDGAEAEEGEGEDNGGAGAGSGNDVTADDADAKETCADDADNDDTLFRPTYNFAPGYHGLVVRPVLDDNSQNKEDAPQYLLQVMKWGLVPSWMQQKQKQSDHAATLKTINCRADSLIGGSGMWAGLRSRHRCVVVASGFYEWLHKAGSRERVPHYIRRRDGRPLLMAGLWDCHGEGKLYTYTIITTDSNATLRFLHDRMPVLLEYGSRELAAWLDPARAWSAELAGLLKPWPKVDDASTDDAGSVLLVDAVSKAVNRAGHSAASMIVPVASAANKGNIANFFAGAAAAEKKRAASDTQETPEKKRRVGGGELSPLPPSLPSPHKSRPASTIKSGKTATAGGGSQKITSFFGKGG